VYKKRESIRNCEDFYLWLTEEEEKMEHVVAFDVSMGKSTIVVYDRFQRCQYEGEIEHTLSGFHDLEAQLESLTKEDGQKPEIVFEATGVYSQGLERLLQENNYDYYRVNPLEAKIQTATMRRHKTDISDAHELAKSHYKTERRMTYVQEEYYEQMHALNRYYDEINDEILYLFNRMHSLLQLSFPMSEKIFSRNSVLFFEMVQQYPHPDLVKDCSNKLMGKQIREATQKHLSIQKSEEKATIFIHAAQNTYSAIPKDDVRCQQLRNYAKRILELKEQKKEIIQQMVKLSQERTEYRVLLTFPGIGETTAVRIIGELGDVRRFENHKQLNAYAGIDIQRYQSGKTQYQDRINKRGNKKLRKILFFMVMSMISLRKKSKNHLVDYYDRLKKQPQKKPHKVAVVACMNKFLKVAFHLIQNNLPYDYDIAASNCS